MAEEPKMLLTRWLTGVDSKDEAGSRVMSREQKAYYTGYKAFADELDIPFFTKMVDLDERIMMAYQGRRSDDVVEALRTVTEQSARDTGLQPAAEYIKRKTEK